jgi:hypothetical protein
MIGENKNFAPMITFLESDLASEVATNQYLRLRENHRWVKRENREKGGEKGRKWA